MVINTQTSKTRTSQIRRQERTRKKQEEIDEQDDQEETKHPELETLDSDESRTSKPKVDHLVFYNSTQGRTNLQSTKRIFCVDLDQQLESN